MRLLIALVGILLLANVTVFLWPQSSDLDKPVAANVYPLREDVNPDMLQLMKEIEEVGSQAPVVAEAEQLTASEQLPAMQVPVTQQTASLLSCYRLGPFLKKVKYQSAQQKLKGAGLELTSFSRLSAKSKVFRLFLGSYSERQNLLDAKGELKSKNVDHFVRAEDDGQYIISLGVYSSRVRADQAILNLNRKLDDVRLREEYLTLPDRYWVYFGLAASDLGNQHLLEQDWGERSVELKPLACDKARI